MTKNQFYLILSLESRKAKKFINHEIVFALSHNSQKCGNQAVFEISFVCKPSALDYKMVHYMSFFDLKFAIQIRNVSNNAKILIKKQTSESVSAQSQLSLDVTTIDCYRSPAGIEQIFKQFFNQVDNVFNIQARTAHTI